MMNFMRSSPRKRRALFLFLLSLAIIFVIALAQRWFWLVPVDRGLMMRAGEMRGTGVGNGLTPIMVALSAVWNTAGRITLMLAAAAILAVIGRRRPALWLVIVVAGGELLNTILKHIFAAPRPDLLPHLDVVHSYSFPSGHAAETMILFGALASIVARCWAWGLAGVMVVLVGISRVWLGVHWPSDVTAGWAEGVGWLILCRAYLRR
jgi:undecaprenyl-diphosphatase